MQDRDTAVAEEFDIRCTGITWIAVDQTRFNSIVIEDTGHSDATPGAGEVECVECVTPHAGAGERPISMRDRYRVSSGECDTRQYHRNQKGQFYQGSTSEKRHEAARSQFCDLFASLVKYECPRSGSVSLLFTRGNLTGKEGNAHGRQQSREPRHRSTAIPRDQLERRRLNATGIVAIAFSQILHPQQS